MSEAANRGSFSAVTAGAAAGFVLLIAIAGEHPLIQPSPPMAREGAYYAPLQETVIAAPSDTPDGPEMAPDVAEMTAPPSEEEEAAAFALLIPSDVAAPPPAPQWIERPNGRDMARLYPQRALAEGVEGRVLLDCLMRRDGRLRCAIVSETPADFGFGRAALRIAERFRGEPPLVDGQRGERANIGLPIQFVTGRRP